MMKLLSLFAGTGLLMAGMGIAGDVLVDVAAAPDVAPGGIGWWMKYSSAGESLVECWYDTRCKCIAFSCHVIPKASFVPPSSLSVPFDLYLNVSLHIGWVLAASHTKKRLLEDLLTPGALDCDKRGYPRCCPVIFDTTAKLDGGDAAKVAFDPAAREVNPACGKCLAWIIRPPFLITPSPLQADRGSQAA